MPSKKTFVPNIVDFLANRDFILAMEPVEQKRFLGEVALIVRQPAFMAVIDDLENTIACAGITNVVENSKVAATINTIEAIKDKFLKLASMFDKLTEGEKDFDKHESI